MITSVRVEYYIIILFQQKRLVECEMCRWQTLARWHTAHYNRIVEWYYDTSVEQFNFLFENSLRSRYGFVNNGQAERVHFEFDAHFMHIQGAVGDGQTLTHIHTLIHFQLIHALWVDTGNAFISFASNYARRISCTWFHKQTPHD